MRKSLNNNNIKKVSPRRQIIILLLVILLALFCFNSVCVILAGIGIPHCLYPEGAITGKVIESSTGLPLADAEVQFSGKFSHYSFDPSAFYCQYDLSHEPQVRQVTDTGGKFALHVLEITTLEISIFKLGCQSQNYVIDTENEFWYDRTSQELLFQIKCNSGE